MKKGKKKSYQKPKVVYENKIETLAINCNTAWIGPTTGCCQTTSCIKQESAS